MVDDVELPGGARYLTWARALLPVTGTEPVVIVLGCEAKSGERIGYAQAARGVTPIGPACHLCDRLDCTDRSLPPITHALDFNPNQRSTARYPFRPI